MYIRLVSSGGDIKITKDGQILLKEVVCYIILLFIKLKFKPFKYYSDHNLDHNSFKFYNFLTSKIYLFLLLAYSTSNSFINSKNSLLTR